MIVGGMVGSVGSGWYTWGQSGSGWCGGVSGSGCFVVDRKSVVVVGVDNWSVVVDGTWWGQW